MGGRRNPPASPHDPWYPRCHPPKTGPCRNLAEAGGGETSLVIPLWEWMQDAPVGPVGVCRTQHGAMEALSKALIAAGRPSRGRVAHIKLIRPAGEEPGYLRGFAERTAVYDGVVIQWR